MFKKIILFYNRFKEKKYAYFVIYTLTFAAASLFVFRHFFLYGKTFIDRGDGISQHYNVLLYYSKLLKQIALNFLHGNFTFPMWDFSLGLGEDILQILNYHEIGDPLALAALISPNSYIDYCYSAIFLMRLYLGGLAFSWFSLWHGNGRFATLLGSFIYIFSGYTLVAVTKHLMFGVPIITLPLILLGMDRIFKERKGLLFGLSVFLAAISNFYLLYIQGILALLYLIYKCYKLCKGEGRGSLAKAAAPVISCFLYALAGLLMSMIILLPVMDIMLSANRIGADNNLSLLYPVKYYLGFLADFTNMQMPGAWTNLGFPPLVLAAVIIMFLKKKQYRGEKLWFIVLTAFALIPFFGYVFNGFGYVTNRWSFAYAMLAGYIFASVFSEFKTLSAAERKRTALIMLIVALLPLIHEDSRTAQTYLSAALLLITALLLVVGGDIGRLREYSVHIVSFALYFVFIGLTTFSMWGLGSSEPESSSLDRYTSYHEPRQII